MSKGLIKTIRMYSIVKPCTSSPHRLRYLNLDSNEIHAVPLLRLLGSGPPNSASKPGSKELQHKEEEEEEGEEKEESELMAANELAARAGGEVSSTAEKRRIPVVASPTPPAANDLSLAPFPELHTLSLANNMVGTVSLATCKKIQLMLTILLKYLNVFFPR